MTDVLVVLVTAGSGEEASGIAEALVLENLAACVNIVAGIRSVYTWKGEVCNDEEVLMVVKTQRERFEALKERIREIHSYDVPEIVAFPVTHGLPDYLSWVLEATRSPGGSR